MAAPWHGNFGGLSGAAQAGDPACDTPVMDERRRIFVTGGAGWLGGYVCGLAAMAGYRVVAPTSREVDVRDESAVRHAIRECRPAGVVHLAYRPSERDTIVDGSAYVAAAAAEAGARLVHMSTDVVFGSGELPFAEGAPAVPVSDYGQLKRLAEAQVTELCPSAVIVRTSLMYGISALGPCQRDVVAAINGAQEIAFFTDEIRSFVCVEDVATAVIALIRMPDPCGPLHVAGPQGYDRAEFARRTALWLGRDPGSLRTATLAGSGLRRPAKLLLDSRRAAALGLVSRTLDVAYSATPPPGVLSEHPQAHPPHADRARSAPSG